MTLSGSDAKRDTHGWIDQLSTQQFSAVLPVLHALAGLCPGEPVHEPIQVHQPPASKGDDVPAAPSNDIVSRWRVIEMALEKATQMANTRIIRDQLLICSELVRSEQIQFTKAQQQKESVSHLDDRSRAPGILKPVAMPLVDAATGLPARPAFERLLGEALAETKDSVLALFVVERLPYVNKRFGRTIGDEVLLFAAQHLAQEMPETNSFSRWSGPAFATILNGNPRTQELRVQAIACKRLSKSIEEGGRSVMLPISCLHMVERLSPGVSLGSLITKMDHFVSAHVTE